MNIKPIHGRLFVLVYALFIFSLIACREMNKNSGPAKPPKDDFEKAHLISDGSVKVPEEIKVDMTLLAASINEASRLARVGEVVSRMINSRKFLEAVAYYKAYTYTDLSGAEIYLEMMEGKENRSQRDFIWNIEIGFGNARKSTVAWTNPGTRTIYLNRKIFSQRGDAQLAGTICHEYLHKLGFQHPKKWTADRQFSVPYWIGGICQDLYIEFYQEFA